MADSTILPGVRARLVAPDGTTTREFYRFFSALSVTASLPGRVDDLTVRVDDLDERVTALEHGGGAVRTILGLQSVKVVGPLEDGSVKLSLAGDVISAPALSFYGALAEYGKGWQTFSGNFAALDNGDDTQSLDLTDLTDTGTGTFKLITRDAKGRVSGSADGTTDDVPEGDDNLYFTDARAQAAVVVSSITDGDTDHSPSGDAVHGALAGKEPAITAGTTAQVWRGDKVFANNVDGPFGIGTSTPNYGSFGNTVTIQHTLHGALEVASTRADATSVLIGAFSGNYLTNSAGHQRIADIQIVSDGTTANQRGGAFYFYVKPNAVTAEVPVFQIRQDGRVIPGTDNAQTLGSSSNRWSVVYAATGAINTSDAREKTDVTPLSADELAAAADLARAIGTYQWLASVADKGADNARHHAGLTVQRAIEIMQSHSLDPFAYGFICYDEWGELPEQWEDIPEERDADGNVIREASRELVQAYRPAGDRYSFRTDELTLFIARGFAARLDALESA